jgi:cytochrome P450
VAAGFGCGHVDAHHPTTCCVPTVSALDLDQNPFDPIGQDTGPFDAHTCSAKSARHLEITQEVSDWIVAELGAPVPATGARGAPWPPSLAGGAGYAAGAVAAPASAPAWTPADFDPHDPRFLDDPYPTYARFRACTPPVFFVPQYQSHWFSGYDDCNEILRSDGTFQKQRPQGTPAPAPAAPPNPIDMLHAFPEGIFMADPPEHTKLRCAFEGPLGDQMSKARTIAAQRAAGALELVGPSGHMELVADYALPVPANVLFDVVGIPDVPGIRGGLLIWETMIVPSHDITQQPQARFLGGSARMALLAYMDGLVREYKAKGDGPGMIGAMCRRNGTSMPVEDVYTSSIDFVVAGYLSTTWLVASAITSLLAQPEQWEALASDPSKMDRAVEEVLRFEPPFQLIDRYVAQDTVLGDVALSRGDTVTAVIGSANRDPARFDHPDALDIDREPGAALTFGGGIHYCIGAPLARIMAPAMLAELLKLNGLALDGRPQWGTDPYMRAMVSLPLSFQP